MITMQIVAAAALAAVVAVSTASAQQRTQRVAGTIDKVEGKTLYIRSASGPVTLTLADNAVIVARVKASAADIKPGDYVASGGVPQPDGTQKAVELRIFPESMRGDGDGHRPGWPGAPNGTMTNGAVGQTVTSVDGPVLTVNQGRRVREKAHRWPERAGFSLGGLRQERAEIRCRRRGRRRHQAAGRHLHGRPHRRGPRRRRA